MRTLHLLSFSLVLIGGALILGPTFGFSSIAADRGTAVSTAPDDSALIALNGTDYDELNDNEFTTIGTLENNVDGPMGVTYELSTDHDRVELEFDGQTGDPIDGYIDMGSGSAEAIGFRCGPPGQMSGPVTVTADIVDASGSGITISDAKMDLTVSCDGDIPDEGDTEFLSLDVTVDPKKNDPNRPDSVTLEWEVENPEDVEFIQFDTSYTEPEQVGPTASPHEIDIKGNNNFPITVTADIDGGERCELTFDEGGTKTLEDCE